jgi:hypothetical protein
LLISKQLSHEIIINSSPENVWALVTDFKSFPDWNPFIRAASGDIKVGARLKIYIQPPGSRGMTFKPVVQKVAPNHELRWLGRLFLPRLFDGEHALIIESSKENYIRFTQREKFTGLLVPFSRSLLSGTARGFEEMNRALKERAERSVSIKQNASG